MKINAPLFGREEMLNETKFPKCDFCRKQCTGCVRCGFVWNCNVCDRCPCWMYEEV